MIKFLQLLALVGGIFAALAALCLFGGCALATRAALYHPDPTQVAPGAAGLSEAREVMFVVGDGTELVTWRAPAQEGEATIVYFHGNASNLANRAAFFRLMVDEGFGLAALSYRGFGGSGGRASEAAIIGDALAFVDALVAEGADPTSLVLYGESLGSGVAVQVAAQRPVAGLVLHAPYDAVDDVAARVAPFLAPRLLLTDRYRSIDHIGDVTAPILWLHGDSDGVIPIAHGQRLFDAARSDKTAVTVPGAGHNDLYGAELFSAHTAPFVRRATGGASSLANDARDG